MNAQPTPEIGALESQAVQASQAGRDEEATGYWGRILAIDAKHARALAALGQRAFRRGDLSTARSLLDRLTAVDGSDPQQWVNLAIVCQGLKDEAGEEGAIRQALARDPLELLALVLRANLLERQGKRHEAAQAYGAVAAVSPPLERLHPDLHPAVTHALQFRDQYNREVAAFLEAALAPHYQQYSGEKLRRFRDSVDIMVGRKRRFDSQSVLYHFPELPAVEFLERDRFPWLDAIEAQTDAIRDEFLEVLKGGDDGFTPYITYPQGVPLNQWAELNNSPRWSSLHLYKLGQRVEQNASRCPRTMAAIDGAPQPDQPGRTPSAMFSLLKPRTRIPSHTGVTNVRLVTHLPLIVPPGCGFRVGNQTREWMPGKAWVFDDTIEHEAWNDSDKLRVVLIFDIWHPDLSPAERALVTRMTAALTQFVGGPGGFEP